MTTQVLLKRSLSLLIAATCLIGCGKIRNTDNYRWSVKTLTDRDAARLVFGKVRASSVAEQTRMPMPKLTQESPRQPFSEDSLFTIDALLLAVKIESDGDFHVIIRDLQTDSTMLAEIPDPDAAWTTPCSHSEEFRAAREAIGRIAEPTYGSLRHLEVPIRIRLTGVGFFDPVHFMPSEEGIPANWREIHPVVNVEVLEGVASPKT